jgi:hypothetical protein
MAATRREGPGQASTRMPRMTDSTPDSSVDFQRCCNRLGGSGVVMVKVFHNVKRLNEI